MKDEIEAIVASSEEGGGMLGTELAQRLRYQYPDFSFRPAYDRLRDYLAKEVPKVVEVGRHGGDIVYGLEGWQLQPPSTDDVRSQVSMWEAWLTPKHDYRLVVAPEGPRVSAILRTSPTPEGASDLDSPSKDVHSQTAREYLETLEDPALRDRLDLELSRDGWWNAWVSILNSNGGAGEWKGFRARRFRTLLRQSLLDAGVQDDQLEQALLQVVNSRGAQDSTRSRNPAPGHLQEDPSRSDARSLAKKLVEAAPASELNKLRFSVRTYLAALSSEEND